MVWFLLLPLGLLLWWVWDLRRAMGLRFRPAFRVARGEVVRRDGGTVRAFPGAIPPARYAVVRWPDGTHFYDGCSGAHARQIYEHLNPKPGEEIEFWELDARRGHKTN